MLVQRFLLSNNYNYGLQKYPNLILKKVFQAFFPNTGISPAIQSEGPGKHSFLYAEEVYKLKLGADKSAFKVELCALGNVTCGPISGPIVILLIMFPSPVC